MNKGLIRVVLPSLQSRMQAIRIFRSGHPKSGYPEYSDAVFHSIALVHQGTFVTNDRKYYDKAKHFGCIELLEDWTP